MVKQLVIEIGTEELPSSYMGDLEKQLNQAFPLFLTDHFLAFSSSRVFVTPRRMVFFVDGIASSQDIPEKIVKGPPLKMALSEDGKETDALKGFLLKCQATQYQVDGNYVYAKVTSQNRETKLFFQEVFPGFLLNFPYEKKMRWENWQLIRPVRWIVAFYGTDRIDFELCGIHTTSVSRNLRGYPAIPIESPEDYFQKMEVNGILLSSEKRKETISHRLVELNQLPSETVLLENVNRTEAPFVAEATFSDQLLELPAEVISTVISDQLKCFPAWRENVLLSTFYFVMNGRRDVDLVRKGYEKVITARLNDARYFYERDLQVPLSERTADLAKMTFMERLGSLADKINRLLLLSSYDPFFSHQENFYSAVLLSKADLSTSMVQELTELQGTIGKTYALLQGENREVAEAIEDHYHPKSESDTLPKTGLGTSLGLLDRIDTLAGAHAIGITVSSSADPLGLRRVANGLIRILLDRPYPVDIKKLLEGSLETYQKINQFDFDGGAVLKNLLVFYLTRVRSMLSIVYRYDIVQAVVSEDWANPYLLKGRCQAITEQINSPEFRILCDSYTRIKNITKEKDMGLLELTPDMVKEEAEKDLLRSLYAVSADMVGKEDQWSETLRSFYQLNAPITRFFDQILVMDEDLTIRKYRLQLLFLILKQVNQFADFSKIVFEGGEK